MKRLLFLLISFMFVMRSDFYCVEISTSESSLFKAETSDKSRLEALAKSCWNNRESNSVQALEYGIAARNLADSLNDLKMYAKVSNFIGVIYLHYNYERAKSIPFFHDALEYGLRSEDTVQIAYAFNNLGDAFYLAENAPLAKEYSSNSLKYFLTLNDSLGIAYSYINLGQVMRLEKNFTEAIEYFNKAIDIREGQGDLRAVASNTLEIALTYYAMSDLSSAEEYFKKSLQQHQEINNKIYSAHCLNGLGDIAYKKGKYKKAEQYYSEALVLNIEREHSFGEISSRVGLALSYSKLGQISKGKNELATAEMLAKNIGLGRKVREVSEAYTHFFMNLNDLKSAVKRYDRFIALYDSLLTSQQLETLKENQNRFQMIQRINKINKDLELKEKEESYLVIFAVLLALIGLVFFQRYITKRRLSNELKISNESKDRLFAVIAHDLKNPFLTLIGYLELLQDTETTEEEKKEYFNNLDLTTKNTYSMLENLLNLSSTKLGKTKYQPQVISIGSIADNVLSTLSVQLEEKSISVSKAMEVDEIYGDRGMLEIVLRNLLSNAIKFSNVNGIILLRSKKNGDKVCIEIVDNGVGMSKETRETLFTSELVESARGTGGEAGTGIGLGLCKEFIDYHGGKIEVESTLGVGSKFRICLPQKS